MKDRKDDSEYQQALRRLIDQKVVSERTAELHLGQIRKQPEINFDTDNIEDVEEPKRTLRSKILIGSLIIIILIVFYLIAK